MLQQKIEYPATVSNCLILLRGAAPNLPAIAKATRRAMKHFMAADRQSATCDCVGLAAKAIANTYADKVIAPAEWLSDDLAGTHDSAARIALKFLIERRDRVYEAKLKSQPNSSMPNNHCDVCHGSGELARYMRGQDVLAYQIGGPSNGFEAGKRWPIPLGFELNDSFPLSTLRQNCRSLVDISSMWQPHGSWYDLARNTANLIHFVGKEVSTLILPTRQVSSVNACDFASNDNNGHIWENRFYTSMIGYFSDIPESRIADHSLVLSTLYYRYSPEEVQDASTLLTVYSSGILKHYHSQDA